MLSALLLTTLAAPGALAPTQLRCEALVDPVGVGSAAPRLSWKLVSSQKNAYDLSQSGYRITVGSKPSSIDLWDSGKVKSSEVYGIKYGGKPLASGQQCWWRVQVFDQNGKASGWSKPAMWSVGLLKPSDWKAQWIGFDEPLAKKASGDPYDGASWIWASEGVTPAYLQRVINLKPGFTKAIARMTADDQFTLIVNGKEVASSDGKTDAWRRPVTVDITKNLTAGENTIHVRAENEAGQAALLASFTISYPNGQKQELKTDGFWEASANETAPFSPVKIIAVYGATPWGKIGPRPLDLPAPRFLRQEFNLAKRIKRATLYGSALGLLELRLNGKPVSDELFMPGWTDYTKRVYVRGYDVTSRLKTGKNAIGVLLGDGWYSGYVGFGGIRNHYGTKTRALVQLEVEYIDGSKATIASDPTWRASTGALLESDFLMGETYDAQLEKNGWDEPGFAGKDWKPVVVGAEVKPQVEAFPGQPVRPYAELRAKTVKTAKPDVYVLDLGQNMAGFARLKIQGKKGQKITLRFAERLSPDGNVYTTNLRGARAIDTYICKGTGIETWTPRFTFHGFQYIEVSGLGHKPTSEEVVGIAISSDTPNTGEIKTSDPMLNRLVQNAWWTQRMNFIDIPTDCPQRDERLGWTGDAQAYIRTASMLTDVQPFFTKWLVTLDDAQRADGQFPMVAPVKVAGDDGGPAWDAAGVICPWTIYDVYGDKELLARHYPQMKKFVDFYVKRSKPDLTPPDSFHCFGDWLNINDGTPPVVIYTAYFAGCARIVSQAAQALGKTEDHAKYNELYEKVKKVFQKNYVAVDGVVAGNSQCAYVLALAFDLVDDPEREMAAKLLVANIENRGWHLSTGFVGTRDIMHVLSKIGRNDVAFRLLHNKTFPSWGFTIANGATSIWERWDGWTPDKGFQDPGMNSFAHYAFGAVVGWMFDQPAGIQNLDPGFRNIRIAPAFDPKLTWLKSSYDSIHGKIVSEWSVKGGKRSMRVVIPPNSSAIIRVPWNYVKSEPKIQIRDYVSGKEPGKGYWECEVGSGEYTFTDSSVGPAGTGHSFN